MSTAIAPRSNGAITKPAAGRGRLEGAEQSDFVLPRVHLYQGLPAEAKQYGKGFDPGDLINTLTGEKIASRRFVPIKGRKQWIKWREPRGSGLEYSYYAKAEVPADDLMWHDEQPPLAQEYINWVVIFEGEEIPVLLSFTKTSLMAGKTINTLEATRGNKGPGLYSLDVKEKSNDKGTWVCPTIRPAGNPPEELVAAAETWFAALSNQDISAEPAPTDGTAADAGGGFNPEGE